MNDPNIHAFVTSVRVAIFRCGIKGQGFKVCEFAILIIMFGGFSVLSNFYCAFSVFTYILSGFSVSNRPQCPPPPPPPPSPFACKLKVENMSRSDDPSTIGSSSSHVNRVLICIKLLLLLSLLLTYHMKFWRHLNSANLNYNAPKLSVAKFKSSLN